MRSVLELTAIRDRIITSVLIKHRLREDELLGTRLYKEYVEARREAIFLLANEGFSPASIGRIMHRDPSTIAHVMGRKKIRMRDSQRARVLLSMTEQGTREAIMDQADLLGAHPLDVIISVLERSTREMRT